MNFDLDTSNYSKEDYYDIFNLDKSLTITESLINEKHETLLNNIKVENIDDEQKKEISQFLTECKKKFATPVFRLSRAVLEMNADTCGL